MTFKTGIILDVIETDAQLAKLFLVEIAKELNARIATRLKSIDTQIRTGTFNYLTTRDPTKTYEALVSGDLAGHFGLPVVGRRARIDTIIQAIANKLEVEFDPITIIGNRYRGGITIRVLMKDLSEVLSLVEGIVVTEKGEILEWLDWLLTYGDQIIISEFEVWIKPGKGRSRKAIMLSKDAGVWRVPTSYAGVVSKNWLTKALNHNDYLNFLESIVQSELKRI